MHAYVKPRRVGIFGWGIVAPKSPNVEAFEKNLEQGGSWLSPFEGFGPSNFMVGNPEFRFADYKGWIDERFPPGRFPQLEKKMGMPVQYAIGAFIQSLQQNPGLEKELVDLGPRAHVYVGTGLGDFPTVCEIGLAYHRALRRWNRFWADPETNSALAAHLANPSKSEEVPPAPETISSPPEREVAEERWWEFWAARSPRLAEYLAELREIESIGVDGDTEVESEKLAVIREKKARFGKLQKRWNAPQPPWDEASPRLLWNIHNTSAAQISMLGRITGMAFAPVAACSSFGYALKLAMNSISLGEAKAVVVGMTDPPPHPLSVGAFHQARVSSADGSVSKPLTRFRGTHVAGGSIIWVLGDLEYMQGKGFRPLGMEPLAVGVTADADHIITPSKEGPTTAIREALATAEMAAAEIGTWDMHATATPGDYTEVQTLRSLLHQDVLVTARKGTFGHGMSAAGGWELTAQYLGYQRGKVFPTPLRESELSKQVRQIHQRFVFDNACAFPSGAAGKLSMGVGGVNACVISRPYR
jgi:3-oxoacyl-(acyl-carrier-protein) synthase